MAKSKIPNKQKSRPRKVKEPFRLTEQQKKYLIAGAALIALIIIFFIVRYNVQTLRLDADGKIVTREGEHILTFNTKTRTQPRYVKVGDVDVPEGYQFDKTDFVTDPNEFIHYFNPDDPSMPVVKVMVGKDDYKSLADTTVTSVPAMLADSVTSEVQVEKHGGRDVAYYIYSGASLDYENTEDPETVAYYVKQMNAYAHESNGRSIIFMIEKQSETGDDFPADEVYIDALDKAIASLNL